LASIKNWTVVNGAWRQSGQKIRGDGDTQITFNDDLPANCKVSFRMNVVKGMRPRVYFDGPNIYVGNEGYSHNLRVYDKDGNEAKNHEGKHVEYENGQTLLI